MRHARLAMCLNACTTILIWPKGFFQVICFDHSRTTTYSLLLLQWAKQEGRPIPAKIDSFNALITRHSFREISLKLFQAFRESPPRPKFPNLVRTGVIKKKARLLIILRKAIGHLRTKPEKCRNFSSLPFLFFLEKLFLFFWFCWPIGHVQERLALVHREDNRFFFGQLIPV